MSDDISTINLKEFVEEGFLQEINRQFLHPLGMAMAVIVKSEDEVTFGGIWDSRDDPEGFHYHREYLPEKDKADNVAALRAKKKKVRLETLGYEIQPVEESVNEHRAI